MRTKVGDADSGAPISTHVTLGSAPGRIEMNSTLKSNIYDLSLEHSQSIGLQLVYSALRIVRTCRFLSEQGYEDA